ncbi:UNVERIFIED_CONTAM: hypothetical protein HDU68_002639 [Siphonaria sp. JEL0065]|nr:hypothetical protein HDU68_002639 [Siphonaria sp. JEL0065]
MTESEKNQEVIDITRVEGYDETLDYSEEEESRVRKLIDASIVSILFFKFFFTNNFNLADSSYAMDSLLHVHLEH